MSYGEYGGNGSVHWLIDADDVDELAEKGGMVGSGRLGGVGEWRQHGVDYHGKADDRGKNFTIRIKLPNRNREVWLAQLRRQVKAAAAGGVFEFTLPIVQSKEPHTQIQICWGRACKWQDHLHKHWRELKNGLPSTPAETPSE
jgi:hypothetical protein